MPKVKITVLKKLNVKDLHGETLSGAFDEGKITPECDRFSLGQEFLTDTHNCPEGFCNWAFVDIHRDLVHILYGGYYPWMKDKRVAVSCCTDGLRPVIFKLERVED